MAEVDQSVNEHGLDGVVEDPHPEEKQEQNEDSSLTEPPPEKRWPGWPGESVFRMLVPAQKVGSIIGRKGEFIKKMCEETRARIKILDGPPGTSERAVMVSAKEEPDVSLPPAIDGVLRVHKRLLDGSESEFAPPGMGGKASTKLLVPAPQAGILIGKQGTTVKSVQEASNCIVRVLGNEDLPIFALEDDRVVEVVGEPSGIHKAIELICSHLRKFLVDRSMIPIFETQMQMPNPQMEQMPPPPQSWGPPPPQSFPPNAGGGGPTGYGASPHFMPPARQHDNYYAPAEMPPPLEKQQPHQGISAYGREAPMSIPSVITQVTQQMQVPLSYADAVIGTAGSSISYIRRASGATVTVQETRGVPGEMTVEINGTASQVQTAQQLIQNFMAEAAAAASAPSQTPTSGSNDQGQGYNSYVTHGSGSVYSSPPSTSGYAGQPGGGYSAAGQTGGGGYGAAGQTGGGGYGAGQSGGAYGSVYGSNYGY